MTRKDTPPTSASTAAPAGRALAYLTNEALKGPLSRVNATAMQTLLGAVQRAGSMDEIEIIVRYQQAREQRGWPRDLIEQILKDLRTSAENHKEDGDRVRAAAQQLGLIARIHRVVEDRGGQR